MTQPTMEQRVRELERRVRDLGDAAATATLRAEAVEAVTFSLALSIASNIRATGVTPGQNADLLMQAVEHFAGFDPDDPISPMRWAVIRAFGEKLVEASNQFPLPPEER